MGVLLSRAELERLKEAAAWLDQQPEVKARERQLAAILEHEMRLAGWDGTGDLRPWFTRCMEINLALDQTQGRPPSIQNWPGYEAR
ncbi:hypothetical protein SEA_REINDEER_107 [Mycobacterium phage Reindeer]|uniref:Uncharacterized protein n=1 Tax=Mycobacterium phage Reindeer TaxID=2762283 RepID=A0A7G8LI34_9CAUD|nr:hypothetical protein J4U05_gp137 [Mycobacterium phage Reindeer]QNJ56906.1 hypothetical protein SEA_REINDEER_107 [Mycobacterium phage Reindeer]